MSKQLLWNVICLLKYQIKGWEHNSKLCIKPTLPKFFLMVLFNDVIDCLTHSSQLELTSLSVCCDFFQAILKTLQLNLSTVFVECIWPQMAIISVFYCRNHCFSCFGLNSAGTLLEENLHWNWNSSICLMAKPLNLFSVILLLLLQFFLW